jgi:hypothetical protein
MCHSIQSLLQEFYPARQSSKIEKVANLETLSNPFAHYHPQLSSVARQSSFANMILICGHR